MRGGRVFVRGRESREGNTSMQSRAAVHAAAVVWGRRSLSPASWAAAQGLRPVSGATHVREPRGAARPCAMPRPLAPLTHPVLWCHHRCLTTGTQENKHYCYTRRSECVHHSKLSACIFLHGVNVYVCRPAKASSIRTNTQSFLRFKGLNACSNKRARNNL